MVLFSDYTCGSDFMLVNSPQSYDSDTTLRSTSGEEEVLLAINCPKHRAGRKKFRETRHPVYRGVRKRKNDKWVCEVREPNKKTRIWLGTYPTAEMAARAHDVAALALRGRSACLNFADSVWRLPVPDSTDAKDIRKTATEAAQAFQHNEPSSNEPENTTMSADDMFYFDEELEINFPGLLADMAQGLLLAPPPSMGIGSSSDRVESVADMSLWSFSI
ncbi:hypothetical protein GIB67_019248 [Kingdonia uniflora]|uniref:AP2/ERF domain-containing protein n=1 Tax=Kingdonia uniflora TaxID=39325 RepID=A0A7J7MZV1_9MAGN|nr:hypothetical protein GIB67_019248 [Kingdonia uniflora]